MQAYLSLGSNLDSTYGGPRQTVLVAARRLAALAPASRAVVSAVYRTAPWGPVAQPDFANAALGLEWAGTPADLHEAALALEREAGRARRERWGPRELDVDLLLFGALVLASPGLEIPHPRLHQRRFVLVPLAEIAPGALHPGQGRSVLDLLAALPDDGKIETWPEPAAVGEGGR